MSLASHQVPGNRHNLHLVRARVDLQDLGVAPPECSDTVPDDS